MELFFILLFLAAMAAVTVGLIKPAKVKASSRKQVLKFGAPAVLSVFVLAGITTAAGDENELEALEESAKENEELQLALDESEETINELELQIEELEETIQTQNAEIEGQKAELQTALEEKSNDGDFEEQTQLIEEKKELLEEKASLINDLEEDVDQKADELQEKDDTIQALESKVDELNAEVDSLASASSSSGSSSGSSSSSSSSDSSGDSGDSCPSGSVRINDASVNELQAIHQIGPDRAEQIVNLRSTPFRSYSDLQRISGIADARAKEIEAQGIICFD